MNNPVIRPTKLLIRCFALRDGDQWMAFTLEFGLASQGDSFQAARRKLELMLVDYVRDALVGVDRQYAHQLLKRRAPLWAYGKYYSLRLRLKANMLAKNIARVFVEPLPVQPTCPA